MENKVFSTLNGYVVKDSKARSDIETLTTNVSNLNDDVINNSSDISTIKGNINTIDDELTTIKGNINTLNENVSNNTRDIENINQSIEDVITKINPIDMYKGKNLVVFGDSYSQENIPNSANAYWVNTVCNATGMNKFNYSIAGAGFARTGNILYTQYENAIAQMSENQRNNTAIVIVYAGYNDIINDVAEDLITTNCVTLINDIKVSYPNAKIILAPFNWGFGQLTGAYNRKIEVLINRITRETSNNPVVVLKLARYWNIGISGYFRNESHPNEQGYKRIASYMLNAIYGNSEHVQIGSDMTYLLEHGNNKEFNYDFNDGNITINFNSDFAGSLSNYSTIMASSLPSIVIPENDVFIPLYTTSEYYSAGYLRITSSGAVAMRIRNLPDGDKIYATPVTYKCNANQNWID